jgi:hypothetical protein
MASFFATWWRSQGEIRGRQLQHVSTAAIVFLASSWAFSSGPLGWGVLFVVTAFILGMSAAKKHERMRDSVLDDNPELWEGADPATKSLVRILTTPRLLNVEMFNAGMFIQENRLGVSASNSSEGESSLSRLFQRVSARSRAGTHTVNGRSFSMPRLVRLEKDSTGPVAFFSAIPGSTENSYDFAADKLEVSLQIGEIRVEQRPVDRREGVMRMSFILEDTLRKPVNPDFLRKNCAVSPFSLPIALTENGHVFSLPLHHTLIVGATGSGKGSVLQSIIYQLAPWQKQHLVTLYGIDPKRAELRGFRESDLFENVEFDFESIVKLAESLVEDVLRPRQKKSGRSFQLSTENPVTVLVIDELSSLTQDRNYVKSGLQESLNILLSQGRSDGVYVIAASQFGHKEVLGTIRQHFANRIALRQDTASEVDMVMGAGALAQGARPHLIEVATESNGYGSAGIAYVISGSFPRPMRVRFPMVTDDDIRSIITDG